MLDAYYDIDAKGEFDTLFKGTYIHGHPTKGKNSYYILRFDFSGLNTSNATILEEEIHDRIFQTCKEFMSRYQIKTELDFGSSAASCMSAFLSRIKIHLNSSIYVIIDESPMGVIILRMNCYPSTMGAQTCAFMISTMPFLKMAMLENSTRCAPMA